MYFSMFLHVAHLSETTTAIVTRKRFFSGVTTNVYRQMIFPPEFFPAVFAWKMFHVRMNLDMLTIISSRPESFIAYPAYEGFFSCMYQHVLVFWFFRRERLFTFVAAKFPDAVYFFSFVRFPVRVKGRLRQKRPTAFLANYFLFVFVNVPVIF